MVIIRGKTGKTHHCCAATISLCDPRDTLTGAEGDTVMNSIPAKNLFDPNGTDLEAKDRSELVASDRIEWSDATGIG